MFVEDEIRVKIILLTNTSMALPPLPMGEAYV